MCRCASEFTTLWRYTNMFIIITNKQLTHSLMQASAAVPADEVVQHWLDTDAGESVGMYHQSDGSSELPLSHRQRLQTHNSQTTDTC